MIKGYREKVMNNYEKIRTNRKHLLNERYKEVTSVAPKIIEIDEKIKLLSVKMSLVAMRGNKNNELELIKQEIDNLKEEKYIQIVSNNFPINYLDLKYTCNECKDTGYIGVKKCSCYQRELVKVLYQESNIKDLLKKNNFELFELELFRDTKKNDEIKSPKNNISEINKNLKLEYFPNFKNDNTNILFYGTSGTGKTFLSLCIAKHLMDKGFLVVYKTADELISSLREIKFNNNKDLENILINCDLLIIDDLGSELISDFSKAELFTFINNKLLKDKKMIISTNLSTQEIQDKYSERIYSRLLGNFKLLPIFGDDLRIKKQKNRRKEKRTQ